MPELLFLDTEWATDDARDLVSLALVNADGTKSFYAERSPLPADCSPFVRSRVYPLLEGRCAALSDDAFGIKLRSFVASWDTPWIHFDSQIDKVQLSEALVGFGAWAGAVPAWVPVLVTDQHVLDEIELYFIARPKMAARRHHARVDAEALRFAYMTVQQ
jgi:hypothetical protein